MIVLLKNSTFTKHNRSNILLLFIVGNNLRRLSCNEQKHLISMTKKTIIRILIFYTLGITLSNVFRFDLLHLNKMQEPLSILELLLTSPLEASGRLVGALISIYLLKKERNLQYSLFGTSRKWSLIMLIIPVILLGVFGIENENSVNTHYYGVIGGVSTLIYCFCEEIGWRGYLQDELGSIKEWQRVLLIGFLWYFWHLSFILNQNFIDNTYFLGWMIFGSWGLGKVIDLTKSIIAVTCFHMLINIMMFNSLMKNGIDGTSKLIILGVSVSIWIFILIKWGKENKTIANNLSKTKSQSIIR